MIAFALEAEHGIRTGMNTAVDHASEMNAEKPETADPAQDK
jgi:hypothetical protein